MIQASLSVSLFLPTVFSTARAAHEKENQFQYHFEINMHSTLPTKKKKAINMIYTSSKQVAGKVTREYIQNSERW